jgi:hypothetical protein
MDELKALAKTRDVNFTGDHPFQRSTPTTSLSDNSIHSQKTLDKSNQTQVHLEQSAKLVK